MYYTFKFLRTFYWFSAVVKKKSAATRSINHIIPVSIYLELTHNMTTDCSLIPDFSTRKIQVENPLCTKIVFLFLFWHTKQFLYTTCSQLVIFLYRSRESMNNLSSYCGLTDSRMSASDTDLPVRCQMEQILQEQVWR